MTFDEWKDHPYTKVLEESIAKDYVPRTDLATVVAAEREACCRAIDAIDDGEAPEYRACQEAIMARSNA